MVANTEKQPLEANTTPKLSENVIKRDAISFEERLRMLKESKKEEQSSGNGLFGFRKQAEKKIEEYTDEESKIKTNILEDVYNQKPNVATIQLSDVDEKYETVAVNAQPVETKEIDQKPEIKTELFSEEFNEMYAKLFGTAPKTEEHAEEKEEDKKISATDIAKDNVSMFETQEEFKKPAYKFIGIVFKTYIILEMNNEMYILDQHAAHERIMYEKVKKNYYSEKEKDSQMLLLPDIITLSHKEMNIAKDNIKMFEQAGFSLEEFGENTIKLTGVPTICVDLDTKELFLETLDEINTVARTAKQEKEERFIATVACKAAVKANMSLTTQEVESLMDKLLQLPNPFTCPHGRPTVIKMTKYDIERKFARK